jgi:hypothetical protein
MGEFDDMLGGMGSGVGAGASIGATLGSVVPGLGTVVGGAVGAGLGAIVGGIEGLIKGGKAEKEKKKALAVLNSIPAIDPNMVRFKDQLAREKRMVDSGMSTDFMVARDIAGEMNAGGMSVAAELAMTNPALGLMVMNQSAQNEDASINKALGTLSTKSMGYTEMLSNFIDKISQRELDVNMMKAETGLGIAMTNLKDVNANANAGKMRGLNWLTSPTGLSSLIPAGVNPAGGLVAKSAGETPDVGENTGQDSTGNYYG